MAYFNWNFAADFRDFDLIGRFDDMEFEQDLLGVNSVLDATDVPGIPVPLAFEDVFMHWSGEPDYDDATDSVSFFGDDNVAGGDGIVSGTLTGLVAFGTDDAGGEIYFVATHFLLSSAAVQAAATSVTTADDFVLLDQMLAGDDSVVGSNFADYVFGRGGNDTMLGGAGFDTLMGDGGDDRLDGGRNADSLTGGVGNDLLYGVGGADRMIGNQGADYMDGGRDINVDTFIYYAAAESTVGSGRDRINNFVSGIDQMQVRGIDANTAVTGNQDFVFSASGPAAHALWTQTVGGSFFVRADVTGDAVADFEVRMLGITSMTAGDFIL